ncbi:MAG: hypothetical protein RL134_2217 [Actinomycetota bacterium]
MQPHRSVRVARPRHAGGSERGRATPPCPHRLTTVLPIPVLQTDVMPPRWMLGSVDTIAPRLLGATLVWDVDGERVTIRVTEVEAYAGEGEDPGSHAFRGPTPRNATMFGPPGHLYVYFTYGMHWCANVVTGAEGRASAILLRAGEVTEGVDLARERRPSARTDRDLARGPARLTTALGLTGEHDGLDLLDPRSPVRLEVARRPLPVHAVTPRTGVAGAGAPTPWRFVTDHPSVSPYRAATPRKRKDIR